jgi:hypothetical protein
MFSNSLNPIKRLTDSLGQTKAQEQARLQRLRSQQGSADPKTIFDAGGTGDEAFFANGEGQDTAPATAEEKMTSTEEPKSVTTADIKNTSLPKEIRIKLAKLAKYEDRHPSTSPFQSNVNKYRAAGCVQRDSSKGCHV